MRTTMIRTTRWTSRISTAFKQENCSAADATRQRMRERTAKQVSVVCSWPTVAGVSSDLRFYSRARPFDNARVSRRCDKIAIIEREGEAMRKPLVGIVMGSQSDWDVMQHAARQLKDFGVPYEARAL